jgi:hypothetical protein
VVVNVDMKLRLEIISELDCEVTSLCGVISDSDTAANVLKPVVGWFVI